MNESAALASEARRDTRRTFADFCELQGLPRDFDLPGLSRGAKYTAVGNGVPVYMARVIACAEPLRVTRCDAVRVRLRTRHDRVEECDGGVSEAA